MQAVQLPCIMHIYKITLRQQILSCIDVANKRHTQVSVPQLLSTVHIHNSMHAFAMHADFCSGVHYTRTTVRSNKCCFHLFYLFVRLNGRVQQQMQARG